MKREYTTELAVRVRAWLAVQSKRLGRAALQSRGVVCALQLLIAAELCMLGVGVVRRLENSYDMAYEASRMEQALLEQQLLMHERSGHGVDISGTGVLDEGDVAGQAPGLRPRDVSTIIAQETGDIEVALRVAMEDGEEDVGEPANAEPGELGEPNDEDEADALIRKGVTALIAGDIRMSIMSFEEASALSPNHPAMLYYYGLAYDKLLNPQKAHEYYERLFRMREKAGQYFDRAARRLAYGMERGSDLRGKLSFGPHKVQHTYDVEQGERVSLLLPILLAPGEEIRSDEVNLHVEFFDLVNGTKVDYAREEPVANWVNEVQNWRSGEEDLVVNYTVPAQDVSELSGGADVKYYGFIAKLFYKGEPMDCISSPSALILHEQQLSRRNRGWGGSSGLLPDDGLNPYSEQAVPFSDVYDDVLDNNTP